MCFCWRASHRFRKKGHLNVNITHVLYKKGFHIPASIVVPHKRNYLVRLSFLFWLWRKCFKYHWPVMKNRYRSNNNSRDRGRFKRRFVKKHHKTQRLGLWTHFFFEILDGRNRSWRCDSKWWPELQKGLLTSVWKRGKCFRKRVTYSKWRCLVSDFSLEEGNVAKKFLFSTDCAMLFLHTFSQKQGIFFVLLFPVWKTC